MVERVERRARRRGWRSPAETASRRDPAHAQAKQQQRGNRLHEPGRCRQRRAKERPAELHSRLPGSRWLAADRTTPQTTPPSPPPPPPPPEAKRCGPRGTKWFVPLGQFGGGLPAILCLCRNRELIQA